MSKTQDALKWMDENPGASAYMAAKKFSIATATLYKAIKQREATKDRRCPCCGQIIPEKK